VIDEAKLLPCSFCGGKPEICQYSKGSDLVYVHCKCGATCGQGVMYSGFDHAITAWNRRTPAGESVDGVVGPDCWSDGPIVHAKVPKHWAGKRVRVTLEDKQ